MSKWIMGSARRGSARVATIALAALVAMVGLVVQASPAGATVPLVWGKVVCDTTTGESNITWIVRGDTNYPNETATIKTQSIATDPTLVGKSVRNSGTVSGVQRDARPGTYTQTVQVQWTNHSWGDLVTARSQPVKVKDDCKPPTPPKPQCPDGTNPGDLNGDGVADSHDCGYTPPPAYTCPPGSTWVDTDGDGVIDHGECQTLPPPAILYPKAHVRAYCVTRHWGEGIARLVNKRSTQPVRYHIVRSGKDRHIKVRAHKNRKVELRHLRVGSTVRIKIGHKVLAHARVKNQCSTPVDTDTGKRMAAG